MLRGYSVLGHFMLIDSLNGQTGDQVTLLSPKVILSAPSILTFFYYMHMNDKDTVGTLTVYRYTQLHTYDKVLFTANGNHEKMWDVARICIPAGTYQLAFVAAVGLPSLSDIAIDGISVDRALEDKLCLDINNSSAEGIVSCTVTIL